MIIFFLFFICCLIKGRNGIPPVDVYVHCREPCPNKTTYYVSSTQVEFVRAFVLCKERDMDLASIMSEKEELALKKHMEGTSKQAGPHNGFWLSGTRWGSG
ncbi:uncharacterized protein LOC115884505 [Sitophilus oryzae]|uniref:Uncharacterized protein LOC115884505 n=1 Tax=Sitophilus oryzae TaxID=7048 RepID=A0A6J2Y5Q0_SITOR|nr:uncharacterized protein LOC115884505 [Sitophilus oryzae]